MVTYGVSAVPSSIPPWAVNQRIGTSAGRYALNSMLMPRTDSGLTYTDYRSGVMASGDGGTTHLAMQVAPSSGMKVTVAQGNAVINTSGQGAYMCCLPTTQTLTLAASSGNQNRIDLVVARVYDDNNSALSGGSGIRQFTVEITQGDSTTGTPLVPNPPVGAIPLAQISVTKNLSTITAAKIADVRGPGLVARGGMRALYGADTKPGAPAYDQAGAYPGDQRWVHTEGFQHQVYYGSGTGWRGVHNAMVYNANPTGNTDWVKGAGARRTVCSVNIPYPGTPFMIYPSARCFVYQTKNTAVDFLIVANASGGSDLTVNWDRVDAGNLVGVTGVDSDTRQGFNIAPIMWGPFTTDVNVRLDGFVYVTAVGGGFATDDFTKTLLSVVVYPSTVQPPTA